MNCYKTAISFVFFGFVLFLLTACSSTKRFADRGSRSGDNGSQIYSEPSEKYSGKILLTLEGTASYYAHDFHGKLTSSGEVYDMNSFTAAHRTFPFGTRIRVTNLENKKTVIVRVNDRGPFKEGRIIDLSLAAAKKIDLVLNGTAHVRLDVIEWGTGQ